MKKSIFRSEARGAWLLIRASKLDAVAFWSIVSGALLSAYADVSVDFPLGVKQLPLALTLPTLLALLLGYSMIDWWDPLSRALVRYGFIHRVFAGSTVTAVAVCACWPVAVSVRSLPVFSSLTIMLTIAVLAVVLVGQYYWIPVALSGFLALTTYLSATEVGRTFVAICNDARSLYIGAASLAISIACYARLGPRNFEVGDDEF